MDQDMETTRKPLKAMKALKSHLNLLNNAKIILLIIFYVF